MTINQGFEPRRAGRPTGGRFVGASLLAGALAVALPILTAQALRAETVLKFAATVPLENATATRVFKPWADKINEEAKGEFRIQVYGLELANSRNVWERTLSGVVDIGWALHGTVGLPFPKTSVITLPSLVEDKQAGAASVALWKLYESGLLADEYKGVKVMGLVALPVQGLASKSKVAKFEDIKGQKIRSADKLSGDIATALGGSPISLSATEVYQALSRGVVDSAIANWIMMGAFRLTEVTNDYVTGVSLGSPSGFIIMNPKAYEKLSDKGRKILEKHVGAGTSREIGSGLEKLSHGLRDSIIKGNAKYNVVELSADEKERWNKALKATQDRWIAETPDGKKVLDQFKAEFDKAKTAN
ncbi:TRAP transporter substrate-binding protein [Pseudorhodoplanes sp.]|uniref:TRAP transporter substrate-binding protein n=1 Tax=Pseudorhodoplanes sp. TaxID=1934341 RepID=UPI003D120222